MKSCIITLDIINEICHPDGKLARYVDRIEQSQLIQNINQVVTRGRENGALIIHVRLGFRPGYADGSDVSPVFSRAKENGLLQLSDWGTQLCDTLDHAESDVEVIKHRVSAFYGTDLDLILRANRIEHLLLTGVATNNAVELTAREAHDRDYRVTFIEDATECADDDSKAASLKFLSRIADVETTQSTVQS